MPRSKKVTLDEKERAATWDAATSKHRSGHATYVEELAVQQKMLVALAAFGQSWGLDLNGATAASHAMFEKLLAEAMPPASKKN